MYSLTVCIMVWQCLKDCVPTKLKTDTAFFAKRPHRTSAWVCQNFPNGCAHDRDTLMQAQKMGNTKWFGIGLYPSTFGWGQKNLALLPKTIPSMPCVQHGHGEHGEDGIQNGIRVKTSSYTHHMQRHHVWQKPQATILCPSWQTKCETATTKPF